MGQCLVAFPFCKRRSRRLSSSLGINPVQVVLARFKALPGRSEWETIGFTCQVGLIHVQSILDSGFKVHQVPHKKTMDQVVKTWILETENLQGFHLCLHVCPGFGIQTSCVDSSWWQRQGSKICRQRRWRNDRFRHYWCRYARWNSWWFNHGRGWSSGNLIVHHLHNIRLRFIRRWHAIILKLILCIRLGSSLSRPVLLQDRVELGQIGFLSFEILWIRLLIGGQE